VRRAEREAGHRRRLGGRTTRPLFHSRRSHGGPGRCSPRDPKGTSSCSSVSCRRGVNLSSSSTGRASHKVWWPTMAAGGRRRPRLLENGACRGTGAIHLPTHVHLGSQSHSGPRLGECLHLCHSPFPQAPDEASSFSFQ
jgi:hypothetical protein